jgi:hypothetical protein
VRLSLEGELVGYENVSVQSSTATQISGGIGAPALGFGIGGGIGENVLLGGRIAFASVKTTSNSDATEASQTQVSILGTPEYVFNGTNVRPFLAASFGYAFSSSNGGSGEVTTGMALLGAGCGVHGFATDSFSIDPNFFAYYETGSVSPPGGGSSMDASGFSLLLGVALSGWLGDGRKSHDAEPADASGSNIPAADPSSWVNAGNGTSANIFAPKDEALHTMVKLTGGSRLTFRTNPKVSDAVAMVVVIAHESPALMQCSALVATTSHGQTSYGPFEVKRVGAGTEAAVTLATTVPLESLNGLLSKDEMVNLQGCGESFSIYPVHTEELQELVNEARAHLRTRKPEEATPAGTAPDGADRQKDATPPDTEPKQAPESSPPSAAP